MRIIFQSLLGLCLASIPPAFAQAADGVHLEEGRRIYNYRCYFCHGYSGNAQTLASTYLSPPPLDFTRTGSVELTRTRMLEVVANGKPGTAMHGFSRVLDERDIARVVDFVRDEFMHRRAVNTRYHTDANGWPRHWRYRAAFPFATGQIPLDTPARNLSATLIRGRRLYLQSCVSCHDRMRVNDEGPIWRKQSVSFPRNNFSYSKVDVISSASIYARHDIPPLPVSLSQEADEGQKLWQQNCAFCHAADGSGENWIGSFLESRPRNLTDPAFMSGMDRDRLRTRIRDGLKNTSMPAWRDVLSPRQIDQIISYIDEAFHPLNAQ